MSQTPANSSTASVSAANRQQMETCIDELAEMGRRNLPLSQFLGEALRRIQHVSAAHSVRFWRPTETGNWETAGQLHANLNPATERVDDVDRVAWMIKTAQSQQLSTRMSAVADGDGRRQARTIAPIVHQGQSVGLIDVTHNLDPHQELSSEIVPFLNAICEIIADSLAQAELQQLRQASVGWQQWDQFTVALMRSPDLVDLAATIVNDGRLLAGCDRLTLLRQSGSRMTTVAVSGVEHIEARSNTVTSLQSIAEKVASGNHPVWFHPASSPEEPAPPFEELAAHVRLVGARMIGLIPIPAESSNHDSQTTSVHRAVMAFEQFQDVTDVPGWQSRAERLARRCEPLLLASLERESIPFLATLQKWRHAPARGWYRRLLPALLLMTLLACILTFVPSEFTVTGTAELVPDLRREVFASGSGIVDQLLVQHGDDVEVDQPLVVLRDPQLDLELPKIMGEIEVVRERLKGVLAVRLVGSTGADAANRARQLTSEEEELKERQQSLIRQRRLIEQQQSALTLRSPIRGKILTWDVATLLSARPVERGQSLLTVGDTSGPWVIEIRVADKDFGHIRRAQKRLKPTLDVDFLLVSDPARSYHGTIRSVSETTHFDDQVGVCVLVTVDVEPNQILNPHAGTTAIPRIHCGRHSLGYVWLHDLIDAIWTRLLF